MDRKQSVVVTKFIEDYKKLKMSVMNVADTLEGYIEELDDHVEEFEEFLGTYEVKLSATVINVYDKERDTINALLKRMDNQIRENDELEDLEEYVNGIKNALDKIEELYDAGALETDDLLRDAHYELILPFEDLETIFVEEGWDYD